MMDLVRTPLRRSQMFAGVLLASAVFLSGCGLGIHAGPGTSEMPVTPTGITVGGHAMGGNQPIVGGAVKLYETASTGVPMDGVYVPASPLTPIGTATTDSNGSFNITNSTGCAHPTSDYTYVTISGGSAGGINNPNTLLMAFSGSCSAPQAFTWVNEVTTVAAAYALSGFISIDTSGATPVVSVTSSPTNYATVVANPFGSNPMSMAGLAHAIQNAENLVNFGGATGTTANAAGTLPGQANTTTVSLNSNVACGSGCTLGQGQSSVMPSFVPQAEINSIADVLQACVSSAGGSAFTGATNMTFTTSSAATTATGSSSTLTLNTQQFSGQFSLAVNGGAATSIHVPLSTTLNSLASAINGNSTYASEGFSAAAAGNVLTLTGPNTNAYSYPYSFSTPSAPTSTAGATATLSFAVAASIGGTVQVAVGSNSPVSGTVTASNNAADFASAVNTALTGSGVTASVSGTTVTLTGPIGTTNTLNFTGTSLTGTDTQVPSFFGTAIAQDADDGSTCGRLFGFTPSLGGAIPTNTLQAMLNLAHNPYANGGAIALFDSIPTSSGAPFTPTLSVAPPDWSISIVYTPEFQATPSAAVPPALPGTRTTYPYWIAADANDNVYSVVFNVSTGPGSSTATSLYGIASNGYLNYATSGDPATQTCPGAACTMNSTIVNTPANGTVSMAYNNPYDMAADGFANLWFPMNGGSNSTYPVLQINTATGNVFQTYNGIQSTMRSIATDRNGNVWMGRNSTSNNLIAEFQYSGTGVDNAAGNGVTDNVGSGYYANQAQGACTTCGTPYGPYESKDKYFGLGYGASSLIATDPYGITIDNNLNVWAADQGTSGTTIQVLPYHGAATTTCAAKSPISITAYYGTYTGYTCSGSTVNNTTNNPNYLVGTLSVGSTPYGIAVDGSGNAWATSSKSHPALQEFTPTTASGVITGVGISGAPNNSYPYGTGSTGVRFPVADGAGNIFLPDNSGQPSIFEFSSIAGAFPNATVGIQPCLVVGGACGANGGADGTTAALNGAHRIQIDSTGSIWIAAGANSTPSSGFSNIVQIIGTAAPTWFAGASKPGIMP